MDNRFIINIIATLASFFITTMVTFFLTPFITKHLGSEAYGYIALVQNLINFGLIITTAFTSMTGRYFTYHARKGESVEANEYLNSAFFSTCILSTVLILCFSFLTLNIQNFFKISFDLLNEVKLITFIQGIVFILTTINSSFLVAAFSQNKLFVNSGISLIGNLLRAIIIFVCFLFMTPHIWYVSLATLIGTLFTLIMSIYISKKLLPNVSLKYKYFKFKKVKEMLSAGLWTSINLSGTLLYLQSDLLIANVFIAPRIAGEYAIIVQLASIIRSIGNTLSSVFTPKYVYLYSEKNFKEILIYSKKAILSVGIIMAPIIGILGGIGEEFLIQWVGEEFAQYYPILIVTCINLALNISVSPLFGLITTLKKVKIPAIIQLFIGGLNVILGIVFVYFLDYSVLGIAITSLISYTLINFIFLPQYIAHILNIKKREFYYVILVNFLITIFVGVCSKILIKFIYPINWIKIIIIIVFLTGVYTLLTLIIYRKFSRRIYEN